jgi:PBP1b-binding outer membrane lipoprotein LpoB
MKINILLLTSILFLTGCSTVVPVKVKFPEVPTQLMNKCPALQKLNDEPKMSDITKTVTSNYNTYYECAVKNDAWIEWYQIQKNIFEGVK